jgi:hypothetical protein
MKYLDDIGSKSTCTTIQQRNQASISPKCGLIQQPETNVWHKSSKTCLGSLNKSFYGPAHHTHFDDPVEYHWYDLLSAQCWNFQWEPINGKCSRQLREGLSARYVDIMVMSGQWNMPSDRSCYLSTLQWSGVGPTADLQFRFGDLLDHDNFPSPKTKTFK